MMIKNNSSLVAKKMQKNFVYYVTNKKSTNPRAQVSKIGTLVRDQGFEPWTP